MRQGYLSEYFEAVAVKRLSAVETDPERSNQHEINGSQGLRGILGDAGSERVSFATRFVWVGGEGEAQTNDGSVTWYDSRAGHPKRSEHRLYYPRTPVWDLANEGDSLFVALRADRTLMIVIAAAQTTIEQQLRWLFDLEGVGGDLFAGHAIDDRTELDFPVRLVLDELGIDIEEPENDRFDQLLEHFGGLLPTTAEFSAFARGTLSEVSARDDPDAALMAWLDREEKLYRSAERRRIAKRLSENFVADGEVDVEGFLPFSLSVQNSRKSRAGHAFENHLGEVFRVCDVRHARGGRTEARSKPDFLFPGIDEYRNPDFPTGSLTMLGAKTTCKDRWRQVLTEADRIPRKHLVTIEPAISENQIDEMRGRNLQLVVPTMVQASFRQSQQAWLMSLSEFIRLVLSRQRV